MSKPGAENRSIDLEAAEFALFGERGARAVVSTSPASLARATAIAAQYGVNVQQIGSVTRADFRIQLTGVPVVRGKVDSFLQTWSEPLEKAIESAS